LTEVEKALAGKPASAASIEAAARNAGATLEDVNSDIHGSADYRRAMIPVFTERALKRALARVG
jgi:carbon-monoxide dehydrogenase medium subunit